ncbi:MAG TPA: DHA2 family efflux MFS transporter permease subunit [Actinomycetes bacterium]|nr:DHA2 family efflux MFS transporter permease subunit [Actinomycetes bacterium]
MTTTPDVAIAAPVTARKWLPVVIVALAQLMIALDATIVNIALPSAQQALHISDANRQLVITAYTLAFGGLLLLGGRIADYLGRKRAFLTGLVGFAAASALGGAATNLGMLLAGRALQGTFAAVLAPTALSLLAVTFTEPAERAKAFAVYGAIAGSGGAAGLLLGGVVTEYLAWRWCLYVNVPIAIAAVIGGWIALPDVRPVGRPRLDIPGVLLATGSLTAVVYACSQAVFNGWGARPVIGLLVAGAVLLILFVVQESRSANPLLPLRIVTSRNRGGAYMATALAVVGMFGMFLALTYYFQVVLRFSPVRAGLAFLPMTVAVMASSTGIASRLLPRVPPRALIAPGLLAAAAALAWLTQLHPDSAYLAHALPAEVLAGLGMGLAFVPVFSIATEGVAPRDTGIASAMVNTANQVGGSIGTAVLNTIAASATAGYLAAHAGGPATAALGLVHGFSVAIGWGAGILAAAALIAAVMIDAGKPSPLREPAR